MKKNVKLLPPDQRLAKSLKRPGGISVEQALARADIQLGKIKEKSLEAIDPKIETLAQEVAGRKAGGLGDIYALASEIFSLAGTFGLKEFSAAAQSLAWLVDVYREMGVGRDPNAGGVAAPPMMWESMRVHVDALRTLRRPELSADAKAASAVVQGLKQVTDRAKAAAGKV